MSNVIKFTDKYEQQVEIDKSNFTLCVSTPYAPWLEMPRLHYHIWDVSEGEEYGITKEEYHRIIKELEGNKDE